MILALKKMNRSYYIGVLSLILLLTSCSASGGIPKQKGFVNDFAGVLSSELKTDLAVFNKEIENKSGVEFVVVTIKYIEGPIESFSDDLFEEWNIGGKELDKKGLLLLIDARKKEAYILNSPSLDSVITNDRKKITIELLMKPSLGKEDFTGAVASGVIHLAKILRDLLGADIKPVFKNIN